MNLIDLAEIWAINNNIDDPKQLLLQDIKIDSRIDQDLLADLIFQYCGSMTPVYNTSYTFLWANQIFFKNWYWQIGQLLDTLEYEYEPLDNFRRNEDLNRGTSEDTKTTTNENETNEGNGTNTTNTNGSSTDEHKVSAYNESLYQPQEYDEHKYNDYGAAQSTTNNNRNLGRTRNEGRTFGAKELNTIRGLNGLFTTQNLIEQQREVVQFNIYMWIVEKYKDTMMYGVF